MSEYFSIERLKDKDEQYWAVYGEGKRATFAEGMVYNNWKWIDYKLLPKVIVNFKKDVYQKLEIELKSFFN